MTVGVQATQHGSNDTAENKPAGRRVVHLLDVSQGGDAAIDACKLSLALPAEHHVWVIGSRTDVRRCEQAGLRGVDLLPSPMGLPRLLARPMRRLLGERARHWPNGGGVVLHAWTWSAAAALARTHKHSGTFVSSHGKDIRPIRTAMLVDAPRCTSSRWIELAHDREHAARVTSACEVAAMTPSAQAWIDRNTNWGGHATIAPPMHAWAMHNNNSNGVAVGDQTNDHANAAFNTNIARSTNPNPNQLITLGLFGPRSSPPDARWFAFMLGLLSVGGWTLRGIAPAWSGDADRARRFIRDHGYRWDLRFAEEPDNQWIGECDAVVVCAESADDVPMFAANADAIGGPVGAVRARLFGSGQQSFGRDIPAGSLDARHVAGALHRWMRGDPSIPAPADPKHGTKRRPLLGALAELWRIDRTI